MKAAVYYGKSDLRITDVEKRLPEANEIVVKIAACGVCGTDFHIYDGAKGAFKTTPPIILGHEFSGVVSDIGVEVKSVKIGDRICIDPNDACGKCYYCRIGKAHFCENMIGIGTTVNGGFAGYCTVPEKQVHRIPDNLSFEEAALTEPVSCCVHGMDLARVKTGDTVMIIGGGTIGLIMLQLARFSGASTLILVEPVKSKRELGASLGADITIDPNTDSIEENLISNHIKSVDVTIECVGAVETMKNAIKYVSKGGTAMLFGLTNPDSEMPLKPYELFEKEITVKASFINPYTQGRAIYLIQSGLVKVKELISKIIVLDQINKVFEDSSYRKKGKIIIKP